MQLLIWFCVTNLLMRQVRKEYQFVGVSSKGCIACCFGLLLPGRCAVGVPSGFHAMQRALIKAVHSSKAKTRNWWCGRGLFSHFIERESIQRRSMCRNSLFNCQATQYIWLDITNPFVITAPLLYPKGQTTGYAKYHHFWSEKCFISPPYHAYTNTQCHVVDVVKRLVPFMPPETIGLRL